jgi:hypothetical protein
MIALSVSLSEVAAAVSPTRERSAPRIGLRPHLAGAHKSDLQLVGGTMLLAGVPTSNREPVAAEEPARQLHPLSARLSMQHGSRRCARHVARREPNLQDGFLPGRKMRVVEERRRVELGETRASTSTICDAARKQTGGS